MAPRNTCATHDETREIWGAPVNPEPTDRSVLGLSLRVLVCGTCFCRNELDRLLVQREGFQRDEERRRRLLDRFLRRRPEPVLVSGMHQPSSHSLVL